MSANLITDPNNLLQYLLNARNGACSWGEVQEFVRGRFEEAAVTELLAQRGNVPSLEMLYAALGEEVKPASVGAGPDNTMPIQDLHRQYLAHGNRDLLIQQLAQNKKFRFGSLSKSDHYWTATESIFVGRDGKVDYVGPGPKTDLQKRAPAPFNPLLMTQLPDDAVSIGYRKTGSFTHAQVFRSASHNFAGTEADFVAAGLAYQYSEIDKHRRQVAQSAKAPEARPIQFLFYIEGLKREVWQQGASEKEARAALWASLDDYEQNAVVQMECLDQKADGPTAADMADTSPLNDQKAATLETRLVTMRTVHRLQQALEIIAVGDAGNDAVAVAREALEETGIWRHLQEQNLQFFGFGEAPRAAGMGYAIKEVVTGTQDEIAKQYAGDLIAVKGAALFGRPGVCEWAIMAKPEQSDPSMQATENSALTSKSLAEQYPIEGSMPPSVAFQLFKLREEEVGKLMLLQTIAASDLNSLDRRGRAVVAALLYSKCSGEAREALLHDKHPHVRNAAAMSQEDLAEELANHDESAPGL